MIIRDAENDAAIHLDFVPLADVLFNLLIFFLLATSLQQSERELQIALPQAQAAGPISAAMREIVINIQSDGRVIVGGKAVSEEQLGSTIRRAVETNPAQKVNVRGDRATPYEHVARVLGVCKAAGISEPYLETVPTQ